MIYILGTLGLTSLVLGAMGYLMDRPRSVNTMKVLFLYQVPDLRDSEWS